MSDMWNQHLTEKCAVFGMYATGLETARFAYYGLCALQHRGQESSGITTSDGNTFYHHGGGGLVAQVFKEEDLDTLKGHVAIGHNRYSTSGGYDDLHCQPILDRGNSFAFAHNGNLPDFPKLKDFLKDRDIDISGLNDSGMMARAIGCYISDGKSLEDAIVTAWPLFTGVFSAVAMTKDKVVAFRDEHGIRPLSLGSIDGGYVVASETTAFDAIDATLIRDVKPGELITIDKDGVSSRQVVAGDQKLDIFEIVYFARPESVMMGLTIADVRKNFGHQLAKEYPLNVDLVIPVPDSSISAALGYAETSGVRFDMGLIKNRYIHRTFIRPTAALRERDLKLKLNPVKSIINGKRIVLVDDSIVRGSTMRKVVRTLFEAGAAEVHLMISSPPVKYPDFYGINTPSQSDLIAANMTTEQIRDYVGATSLNYLSFDGMISATGLPESKFSCSCFNGVYPISIGSRADEITDPLPKTRIIERPASALTPTSIAA